jgi:peptidoglycan/xylan/chitin deacetylase (PgdA/CDA1 family)
MSNTSSTRTHQYPKTAYGFYLALSLLIAICLEGIIYLMMLGNTLGPFKIFQKEEPVNPGMARGIKVAILLSRSSASLFSENPQAFDIPERQWERILKHEGIPPHVISDAELGKGLGDATVLILPGAACLGKDQRMTIRNFLADGKGVIASGPVGTRNANCEWQGWDFLTGLTGAQSASTFTPSTNVDLTFRGQLYFSEKIPAGLKLEVPSQELTLLNAEEPDAFLSDWMLRPAESKPISAVALAVHHMNASGRVVWFGFNSVLPAERDIDQSLIDHYLLSSVYWAARQPLAILGNWPQKKLSAALIAVEVQQDFANAAALSSLMKAEGLPATFFCDSAEAGAKPQFVRDFHSIGEVASLGTTGKPLQGQLPRAQAEQLQQSKLDLEKIEPGKVLGYAPPEGLSDAATIVALNDAGYRYELNEMAVTRAVPEIVDFTSSVFFPFQKAEVSKIFRTSSDDFDILANYHGPEQPSADLAEGFLSDFRRISYLGGVYTLYIHSYLLGRPEYHDTLKNVLDHVRAQPAWVTTGSELIDWWTARNKVEVQSSKISVHRIRIDVANKGLADLENASVYLYLPYHANNIQISAIVFRLRSPKFQMLGHDDILRVDFPRLSAQTNYTYIVQMDE